MIRYNNITTDVFINTLSDSNAIKRNRQFICSQVFVTDFGYTPILLIKSRRDVHHSMKHLFNNVWLPPAIIVDFEGEQVQGEAQSIYEKVGCQIQQLKKRIPWANRAELYVDIFKKSISKDLRASNAKLLFWCYCDERRSKIINSIDRDN